jgi:orotidine-5'-phosphate decarboxylase
MEQGSNRTQPMRAKTGSAAWRKVEECWSEGKFLCVGLDPVLERLPAAIQSGDPGERIFEFNRAIVDATADLVCAFKPNAAFYEQYGEAGYRALSETIAFIKSNYPGITVILDAKRGDIGSTTEAYARAVFDVLGADALTVNPYLGEEAVRPFLERADRGLLILCKTSNSGAAEFQDAIVGDTGRPLYLVVADHVARLWNSRGNCGLVVGATYPTDLGRVRDTVGGDVPILMPGLGAQGANAELALAGRGDPSWGLIANAARSVIYASAGADFAEAARREAEKLSVDLSEALK